MATCHSVPSTCLSPLMWGSATPLPAVPGSPHGPWGVGAHRNSRLAPFSAPQAYSQLQLFPGPGYPSCQLCSYFALQIQPQWGQAPVPSILNHQPKMLFLFPTVQTPIAFDAVIASFSVIIILQQEQVRQTSDFPWERQARKKPLCFQPCITTS